MAMGLGVLSLVVILILRKMSKDKAERFVKIVKANVMWSPVLRGQI
jgi:hypothetical protein